MKLLDYKLIYFLGIGGIGMSALARYFNHYGIKVAGYDKTPTSLTTELQQEGIEIHFDENVEYVIRDLVVAEKVSEVAAIKAVRSFAVEQQQEMGAGKGIIMDGRDIGTTVFPDAELKIFMTADNAVRVARRFKELYEKNPNVSVEEVKANLEMRDYIDSHREVSPLQKAEDAVVIDNSDITPEQQLQLALKYVKMRQADVKSRV